MKLYNSLLSEQLARRDIENPKDPLPFKPIQDKNIRIYSCGPTVYDHAHIGNMAAYIFADTLRRVLQMAFPSHNTQHTMNYTDVDDKTISRSRELYPELDPREALTKLTDKYIDLFLRDMQAVGNDVNAMHFMRATDNITQMQQLITDLLKGNFAYLAEDGIYFSIEAYKNGGYIYGQLSQIDANTTSEARIANDEYDKEEAHDFALWKKQKDGEPAWEFNVDGVDVSGRPGWHIECSAMSEAALGLPFDIHTGGIDLKFPHHENEIAQSTALSNDDKRMAQFFCHNNHILVDGRKMAKSANNFYTLDDIIAKGYDPLAFRLLVLQSHYRNQVNFTFESLDAAQNRLQDFREMAALRWQMAQTSTGQSSLLKNIQSKISEAMDNDLSTPEALAALSQAPKEWLRLVSESDAQSMSSFLQYLDRLFGLKLLEVGNLNDEQTQTLNQRENARRQKDWPKVDQLRDQLNQQGIGLRDLQDGTSIWYWDNKK